MPRHRSVAVIGYLANCTRLNGCAHTGGGVEMGGKNDYNPAFIVSPLAGIAARFGSSVIFEPAITSGGASSTNTSGFPAAVAAARAAAVTVVVVGLDGDNEGECVPDSGFPVGRVSHRVFPCRPANCLSHVSMQKHPSGRTTVTPATVTTATTIATARTAAAEMELPAITSGATTAATLR